MADLDTHRSCQVYLEQDECILAIFDDCTASGAYPRQWEGRIEPNDALRIHPIHLGRSPPLRPPSACRGMLEGATTSQASALLTCEDSARPHEGIYLEGLDPNAPPLGSTDPAGEIPLRPRSTAKLDYVPDAVLISRQGTHELWALIAAVEVGVDAGILVRPLDPGAGSETGIRVPNARRLAALPSGDRVVVASTRGLSLVDVATRAITTSTQTAREVVALALSPSGDTLFVATDDDREGLETWIERRSATDFSHLTPPVKLEAGVHQLLALPRPPAGTSSAAPELLVVGHLRAPWEDSALFTFTSSLAQHDLGQNDFAIGDVIALPEPNRVAYASVHRNAYREIDVTTGMTELLVPVAVFGSIHAIAYDAARGGVWAAGAGRFLTFIDRARGRALQPAYDLAGAHHVTGLAVHPSNGRVYAVFGEVGYASVFVPTPGD